MRLEYLNGPRANWKGLVQTSGTSSCQDRGADAGERFFRRSAHQGGIAERKAMIDREHDLPITKQAEVLKISRGSVYYLPRPVSSADLAIMQRLDRLHLEFPFAGSRMLRGLLAAEGSKIGRRHVKTLMRRMGIEALYRRPRTTKPEPGHKIYPYLPRHGDHAPKPGLGNGHHLHPDGARLRVSRCRSRLGNPPGSVVAAVDHDGGGLLRRDTGGRPRSSRQARNLQYRPGLAVHRRGLHQRARQQRHRDQHGWQRSMAGQRVRRAAVAQRQIRGGISAGLRKRWPSAGLDRPLPRLL